MINIIFPTILIHGIGGNKADLNSLRLSLSERGANVYNLEIEILIRLYNKLWNLKLKNIYLLFLY